MARRVRTCCSAQSLHGGRSSRFPGSQTACVKRGGNPVPATDAGTQCADLTTEASGGIIAVTAAFQAAGICARLQQHQPAPPISDIR